MVRSPAWLSRCQHDAESFKLRLASEEPHSLSSLWGACLQALCRNAYLMRECTDRVSLLIDKASQAGTYADKMVSKGEWTAKVTDKFPLEIGGGLPLVALTAFQICSLLTRSVLPSLKPRQTKLCGHKKVTCAGCWQRCCMLGARLAGSTRQHTGCGRPVADLMSGW